MIWLFKLDLRLTCHKYGGSSFKIAEQIFEELDNDYFIQCKIISQSWKNFMEENKFSYIRLIKKLTDCSKKAIEKIFPKINLEDTIRLASDIKDGKWEGSHWSVFDKISHGCKIWIFVSLPTANRQYRKQKWRYSCMC